MCYSEEVRLDRPASELADCGRPHASRGAAQLERGGPLALFYARWRKTLAARGQGRERARASGDFTD